MDDKKLKLLFEYQAFEKNETLQKVLDSVSAECGMRELSEEEGFMVSAAGSPESAGAQGKVVEKDDKKPPKGPAPKGVQ